ncbi:MAG TPA: DMT family transporter [Verrucomicrobiae bacterium]|nr:DMT family transporter [Verrucomicrobiae bacterium]
MHSFRGVALFVLGTLLFACMDTSIKLLASAYAVPVVVAVRYGVHLLLMVVLLVPSQGRSLIRTQRTGLVLVRAGCISGASLMFGLALQRMPVAEATAFLFVAPLLVVVVGSLVLKERVGTLGWIAAFAGFGGILLIARPGGGLDPIGVALALGTACLSTGYALLSRTLATTESTLAMLFWTALVGTAIFGTMAPFFWGGPAPTALQMALFVGVGVCGGLGHFLFTAAHRDAPASTLAPLAYSQLVFAALLGWLVFGAVPDAIGILGMTIVVAAGIVVAFKQRLARQVAAEPAE